MANSPVRRSKNATKSIPQSELDQQRAEDEGMTAPESGPMAIPEAERSPSNDQSATPQDEPPRREGAELEEGSYSAARRYRAGVAKSIAKGNVEELAKKARRAVEGAEGKELRRAEQVAKRGRAR